MPQKQVEASFVFKESTECFSLKQEQFWFYCFRKEQLRTPGTLITHIIVLFSITWYIQSLQKTFPTKGFLISRQEQKYFSSPTHAQAMFSSQLMKLNKVNSCQWYNHSLAQSNKVIKIGPGHSQWKRHNKVIEALKCPLKGECKHIFFFSLR